MTFVDHRINERMSQFWPISCEQQALSAVEIVEAAEGIRRQVWRDDTPGDPKLKERKREAIAELLRVSPVTVYMVHDNEYAIDKAGLLDKLKIAFAHIGGDQPVAVGFLDIFIVLVRPGEDKFVGLDCFDEKPSERLLKGDLHFSGHASTPKEARRVLVNGGMFQKD